MTLYLQLTLFWSMFQNAVRHAKSLLDKSYTTQIRYEVNGFTKFPVLKI